MTNFVYSPLNHFKEFLHLRSNNVSIPAPLQPLLQRLESHRPLDVSKVRSVMREEGLLRYFAYAPAVVRVIEGDENCITAAERAILEKKFDLINAAWQVVRRDQNRNNMLSYSYILHKLCPTKCAVSRCNVENDRRWVLIKEYLSSRGNTIDTKDP